MDDSKLGLGRILNWGPFRLIATRIRNKLAVGLLCVAVVPLLFLGLALHFASSGALQEQASSRLETARQSKADQIEDYFASIQTQAVSFAENQMVVEAMKLFSQDTQTILDETQPSPQQLLQMRDALRKYYAENLTADQAAAGVSVDELLSGLNDDGVFLQYHYVQANPNPAGTKGLMKRAEDGSSYSGYHAEFHQMFFNFAKRLGLSDIALVDSRSGNVVYSLAKGPEFMTSLQSGPFATTTLGEAFAELAGSNDSESAIVTDFSRYPATVGEAVSFVAAPILEDGFNSGVLVFQLPVRRLNELLADRTGLGETGETYLVGADGMFRTESRFAKAIGETSAVLNSHAVVKTEALAAALAGEVGTEIVDDYRGQEVLCSWMPLNIPHADVKWALISQIDAEEVWAPLSAMSRQSMLIAGMTLVLVLAVSYLITRQITQQTNSIMEMLQLIGIGDFDARAEVLTDDELGTVALSLNAMCDNTLNLIQSREERDAIEKAIESLKQEVSNVAYGDLTISVDVQEKFTGSIAESINFMVAQLRLIVNNVKEATGEVTTSTKNICEKTFELSRGSESQSTQIQQTSAEISRMAKSIQQVAQTTQESALIADTTHESAAHGHHAVLETMQGMDRLREQMQNCAKRMKRLGESSQEIGEIVQVIGDIADRTSILALNASIQAATAGEAGQGFAVVAEEIERLAERCNQATKQISSRIKAIQGDTAEAITAMEESTREVVHGSQLTEQAGQALSQIDQVSQQLAELINAISAETEQQAHGAEALNQTMQQIAAITVETASGTKNAVDSVQALADLAADLSESVSAFILPDSPELENSSIFDDEDLVNTGSRFASGVLQYRSESSLAGSPSSLKAASESALRTKKETEPESDNVLD